MWEKFTMLLVIKKCFSTVDTFCNSFGCHLVYQLLNNLKNWGEGSVKIFCVSIHRRKLLATCF